MTTTLFVLMAIAFCLGCTVGYFEHIEDRSKYFATHDTDWFDRFAWRLMGFVKIVFCLAILGGIIRLYFMLG